MLVAVQALQSQISFLKSLDRNDVSNGISGLSQYLAKVNSSTNKRDLLTVESRVGHLYFRNYVKLFDPKYGFTRGVVAGLCVCVCVF
jgi:CRISPR/Cas system-associated endonuclease Cas1